jgi:hypothetical protein
MPPQNRPRGSQHSAGTGPARQLRRCVHHILDAVARPAARSRERSTLVAEQPRTAVMEVQQLQTLSTRLTERDLCQKRSPAASPRQKSDAGQVSGFSRRSGSLTLRPPQYGGSVTPRCGQIGLPVSEAGLALTAGRARRYPCSGCIQYSSCDMELPRLCTIYTFMNRFIIANPVRNVIRFLWSSKVCAWVLNRFIKSGVYAQESGPGAGRLLRRPEMSCYACASEWAAYRGAARPEKKE